MSILSGNAIAECVRTGEIEIDPYDPNLLNPASVDLRLGTGVAAYAEAPLRSMDVKQPRAVDRMEIRVGGLTLLPGHLYLMHTVERVHTKTLVPVLDGKSSIGRLGIFTHVTAGYGDPGFDGQYTLEVITTYPVRIYAGMRFCQMRFHKLDGEPMDYRARGSYTGEASKGAVPSQCWKQFRET